MTVDDRRFGARLYAARIVRDQNRDRAAARDYWRACRTASMASSGCQNPSVTFMALTARAADHAVRSLTAKEL